MRTGSRCSSFNANLRPPPKNDCDSELREPGLSEFLSGKCAWPQVVQRTPGSPSLLRYISSGAPDQPELLTRVHMSQLLTEAREFFDYILIDCPSFPRAYEALALSQMADATLSVLRLLKTLTKLAFDHIAQISSVARLHAVIVADDNIESSLSLATPGVAALRQTHSAQYVPFDLQLKNGLPRDARTPHSIVGALATADSEFRNENLLPASGGPIMGSLREVGLSVRATAPPAEASGTNHPRQAGWRRRVIIVIPTLNEALHIGAVVRLLAEEIPESADACIVVVDGGSTDGTQEIVVALAQQYAAVHCINNLARIQSAGINLALFHFGRDAEVLIRCDAHASYPVKYCERLLDSLERSGADAVVVAMDSVGHSPLQAAVAWVSNSIVGTGGAAHRGAYRSGFVDHGHHAAFRVETFRRTGGYDESFTHNEDAEFDCRQRALGATLFLDADIRVRYAPRPSWQGLARQYYRYGAGRSRTVRRHPDSIRLRQMVVPTNLVLCGLAVCLSPWFAGSLLWPAVYFLGLVGTSLALAARHRSMIGLLTGPAAGMMHIAWAVGFIDGWLRGHDKVWQPNSTVPLWITAP